MDILTRVSEILTEALNIDHDIITPTATIKGDLGAESIDMLDLIFRLEREFQIQIPRNELFPDHIFTPQDHYITPTGTINNDGIKKLKTALPHSDFTDFEKNPHTDNIEQLFTVTTLCRYINHKLTTKPSPNHSPTPPPPSPTPCIRVL